MVDPYDAGALLHALTMTPGHAPFTSFIADLRGLLQRNTLRVTGHPVWDVDAVDIEDQADDGTLVVFYGTWGQEPTRLRLCAELSAEPLRNGVEIVVMATHGDLDATSPRRGTQHNARHGNPALIARALACVVIAARRSGVTPLIADPINSTVAQHYQTMGFEQLPGQSKQALDLLDPDRLLRVAAFVCAAHQRQSRLLDGRVLPHLDFR